MKPRPQAAKQKTPQPMPGRPPLAAITEAIANAAKPAANINPLQPILVSSVEPPPRDACQAQKRRASGVSTTMKPPSKAGYQVTGISQPSTWRSVNARAHRVKTLNSCE